MKSRLFKKGQMDFPILYFVVTIIVLILIAPILLKVVKIPLAHFSSAVGNQTLEAGQRVDFISGTFVTWLDKVILIAFLTTIILLFLSAFLVDTHPVFLVFYVLLSFFTMLFAPTAITALEKVYYGGQFTEEVAYLPFTEFLLNNFGILLVAIMVVSGVIIYAKYKTGSGGSGH